MTSWAESNLHAEKKEVGWHHYTRSPIRLQHLSVQCKQTLKCYNLIGLQNSCRHSNAAIWLDCKILAVVQIRVWWCHPTSHFSAWRLGSAQLTQHNSHNTHNTTHTTHTHTHTHTQTCAHTEPGCSQCHQGITLGDWRDPLDPDLDSQVILSQYQEGKSALIKKFLGGEYVWWVYVLVCSKAGRGNHCYQIWRQLCVRTPILYSEVCLYFQLKGPFF